MSTTFFQIDESDPDLMLLTPNLWVTIPDYY